MELCRLCTTEHENPFDSRILCHIEEGKSAIVEKLLKSCNEFRDLADRSGSTLLHYAAKFSNLKLLDFLINSASDVNAKDGNGNTPLMLIIPTAQRKIIVKLLEAKARIDIKNNVGEDALCMIARLWPRPSHELENRVHIVNRFLLQLKLECSNDCRTMADRLLESECPLYFAVYLKNATVTDVILQSRKIDSRELADATHLVADMLLYFEFSTEDTSQKLEIFELLLSYTNFHDDELRGQIGALLEEGSREVVRMLLPRIDLRTKVTVRIYTG